MSRKRIKALILDYGGVISLPQNLENVNNILQSLKQEYAGFMKVYYSQRTKYDSGEITGKQYWENVLRFYDLDPLNFEISSLIDEDVKSWTKLNQPMLRFLTENRNKIHKLAIISNMTNDSLAFIRSNFNWLELFDELSFSCELGMNKPDIAIYATCAKNLNVNPEECLFVDDSAENVRGAIKAGMSAIQYKSFPEFLQELDENFCVVQPNGDFHI